MVKIKNIRIWFFIHKWTSLVCTLFLLNLCVTGLPLIFADEIDDWLNPPVAFANLPASTPMVNLDSIVHISIHRYPNQVISALFIDDDHPQIFVTIRPSLHADEKLSHFIKFDSRTAKLLEDIPPSSQRPETFIGLMFSLHKDLFMDLPGELFVGFMGLLFVAALISGAMLYGPFMKKLEFGTIRYNRSRRLKWLDLHNLIGIVILAWMLVIGITGIMNELSTPLFGIWQNTKVRDMLRPYQNIAVPKQGELHPVQAAFDTAQQALPGMTVTSIVFPGSEFGSPYHYLLWAKGNKQLTSRLFSPVVVDARTGRLSALIIMPWYLRTLEVSRPLHFGDYGGLPLKIIWVLFDIAAIIVLISGLYLWFAQRKSKDEWLQKILDNNTDKIENEN